MYVKEKENTLNYYPQCVSWIMAPLPSSQGRYWIRRQTAILKANTARHLQKPGAGGREKMTEGTGIDGGKDVVVMLGLELVPDKQLESLYDCDEGTN